MPYMWPLKTRRSHVLDEKIDATEWKRRSDAQRAAMKRLIQSTEGGPAPMTPRQADKWERDTQRTADKAIPTARELALRRVEKKQKPLRKMGK